MQHDTSQAFLRRRRLGNSVVRILSELVYPESDHRDPQLPAELPFLPSLSCRLIYFEPPNFAAQWPAEPVSRPGLMEELHGLIPPPPVILEHPRKFLAVAEGVAAVLRRVYPDDSRLPVLATLADEAAQRAVQPHEHGDRRIWMPTQSMDRFWAVFYGAATPSWLVERLQAAFDSIVDLLVENGWGPTDPDNRYRPFFRHDRWAFFAFGRARRVVHYATTGLLGLHGTLDA